MTPDFAPDAILVSSSFARSALRQTQGRAMLKPMKIGEIFKRRRKELGMTQQELALSVGWDAGNISRVERGEQQITEDRIFAIARALNLQLALNPAAHRVAENGALYDTATSTSGPAKREVPIVGNTTGGTGGYWEELGYPTGFGDGFLDIPSSDPNAYGLRVRGNSMSPRMYEGEVILVEPGRQCSPGDDVVVRTAEGQVMVKVFISRRNGQITLGSISNDERLVFTADQIQHMHFVAGVFRPGTVVHR